MAEPFRAQLTTKIDTSILFCVVSSSQKADVYLLGCQSVVETHTTSDVATFCQGFTVSPPIYFKGQSPNEIISHPI